MSENPLIYAELLSNIRQISVIAALHTPCDASTKVELSPDGLRFILTHGAKTTTLSLPGQVAANSQLQKPLIGSQELSWRLPLASPPPRADDAQSNEAPWSAASLSSDAEFQCRECRAVIVKQESIKTWKDLPSENWAEMMDFWHCHKPDVPHAHGSSAPPVLDKGYGANTKFSARAGTGFVDLTTFLLSDADCAGILVRHVLFFSWQLIVLMGIKKVAMRCASGSVVWSPIQIPEIDTLLPIHISRLAYPFPRIVGYLSGWGV